MHSDLLKYPIDASIYEYLMLEVNPWSNTTETSKWDIDFIQYLLQQ
jgi:hypothetical protein